MKKKEMLSKIENLVKNVENLYKLNDKLVRDLEEAQDKLNYLLNSDKSCKLHLESEYSFKTNKYHTYIYADYFDYNTFKEINNVQVSNLCNLDDLDSTVLKDLEKDGLIVREQFNEIPPHVEYSFSEMGRDLMSVFYSIMVWGFKHEKDIPDYK